MAAIQSVQEDMSARMGSASPNSNAPADAQIVTTATVVPTSSVLTDEEKARNVTVVCVRHQFLAPNAEIVTTATVVPTSSVSTGAAKAGNVNMASVCDQDQATAIPNVTRAMNV